MVFMLHSLSFWRARVTYIIFHWESKWAYMELGWNKLRFNKFSWSNHFIIYEVLYTTCTAYEPSTWTEYIHIKKIQYIMTHLKIWYIKHILLFETWSIMCIWLKVLWYLSHSSAGINLGERVYWVTIPNFWLLF